MVQTHIKPYHQQMLEKTRREEQSHLYLRNQVLGMVLLAGAILVWWLFATNLSWIFPPGWWRP
jgi:hypothetical protein